MAEEMPRDQLPTVPRELVADPSTLDQTGAYEPALETLPGFPDTPADAPVIPGYAITSMIAKGGMGRVWLGHDLTLDRDVAIKTLLPRADAGRFVAESKITAKLPHPGIPPVHAMGMLTDSSPYLVMKFVQGRTLAAMLDERPSPSVDLPRFVQIFEQIAQAVGFAHSQGVIHRDLKPLNVMVGAFGEVQVMDWGLAKDMASRERERLEESNSENGEFTQAGTVMGTPGYMAPEQARGEAVDARADVFALGAMLAAILTGKPAFVGTTVKETIAKAAQADLADVLTRLDESSTDMELVAMAKRCLAASAANRPLDGRAVAEAVATYRAGVESRLHAANEEAAASHAREIEQRKRRKAIQWAAGIVAGVLLAGVVGTSVGLLQAKKESGEKELARQAEAARAEGERRAKEDAEEKRAEAVQNLGYYTEGNAILGSVFEGLDPTAHHSTLADLRNALKENLRNAVQKLDNSSIGDPLVVAAMRSKLGLSLLGLGEPQPAIALLDKARATLTAKLGPDHGDTLRSLNNLATGYLAAGMLDRALPLFEESFERTKAAFGKNHPDTLVSMNNLAQAYQDNGKNDRALPLFEEAFERKRASIGEDHPNTLTGMSNLALSYEAAGKTDRALPLLEEALSRRIVVLGEDHPDTLVGMNNLARVFLDAGKPDRALPLLEKAFERKKATLGSNHPDTLTTMGNLALAHQGTGRLDRALPLLEEAFDRKRTVLGEDHPGTITGMNNLASCYQDAGKLDKAVPLYEKALKLQMTKLGPDHPDAFTGMSNLASAYQDAGKLDKALPLFEKSLELRKTHLGPDHPDTLAGMSNLASAFKDAGKLDRALPLYENSLDRRRVTLGPDHPDTLNTMGLLALAYEDACRLDLALPLYEETLARRRKVRGDNHPETRVTLYNLALAYCAANRPTDAVKAIGEYLSQGSSKRKKNDSDFADDLAAFSLELLSIGQARHAEPLLRDCLKIREKVAPKLWSTFNTQSMLGGALLGQKKYAEAEPLLVKGYGGMKAREKTIPPTGVARLPEALDRLIAYYTTTNKPDEAKKWQAERAKYPNELAPRPQLVK